MTLVGWRGVAFVAALGGLSGCPPPRITAVPIRPVEVLPAGVPATIAEAERFFAMRPDLASVKMAHGLFDAAARAEPASVDARAGVVRTAAWLVEAKVQEERAEIIDAAVHAAQTCAGDPARCGYWKAVALGLRAREYPAQGLQEVRTIIELLKAAEAQEPGLDDGGPARVLALLLVRAPGWPVGPGDPDAAVTWARKAVDEAPEHPLNHAVLAEALTAVDERDAAAAEYRRAIELGQVRGDADGKKWAYDAQLKLSAL